MGNEENSASNLWSLSFIIIRKDVKEGDEKGVWETEETEQVLGQSLGGDWYFHQRIKNQRADGAKSIRRLWLCVGSLMVHENLPHLCQQKNSQILFPVLKGWQRLLIFELIRNGSQK